MGNTTEIAWCDKTWSPWTGCSRVSTGCQNCWAEEMMDKRFKLASWGPNGTRTKTKDWDKPRAWNRQAERAGKRFRVFPSICDPFEDRPGLEAWRNEFFALISDTPHLIWLLLTKRQENIERMLDRLCWPESGCFMPFGDDGLPENVWLGTSVENQETADERIPWILKCPARVRFLSCEPLLGPVDFGRSLGRWTTHHLQVDIEGALRHNSFGGYTDDRGRPMPKRAVKAEFERLQKLGHRYFPMGECEGFDPITGCPGHKKSTIDWIIVGGESGPKARPMHPQWARSIRDQCQAAGVPFFHKQNGEWREPIEGERYSTANGMAAGPAAYILDENGNVHCFRNEELANPCVVLRVGKKAAGRVLDGREWNEFPEVDS